MKELEKHTQEHIEAKIVEVMKKQRESVAQRFPLVFGLAVSFGLVSTFYGFEGLINRIPFLQSNPWLVLATGLTILIITGTAYKKLN